MKRLAVEPSLACKAAFAPARDESMADRADEISLRKDCPWLFKSLSICANSLLMELARSSKALYCVTSGPTSTPGRGAGACCGGCWGGWYAGGAVLCGGGVYTGAGVGLRLGWLG